MAAYISGFPSLPLVPLCRCSACTGRPTTQVSGIAVREYGTVVPFGPDGTYMVFERLDSAEAVKRRGSDGGGSGGSGRSSSVSGDVAATKRLRSFALLGRGVCILNVWKWGGGGCKLRPAVPLCD